MFDKLDAILRQTIRALFLILLFCLPLIFWIPNSEVFELPKMYFVYAMTTLISGLWLARMVVRREIVVKRTPLDIPILLFLLSQIASTIYSIDPHVSWLGWYGRFNGGLLSTIGYTVLYYAFVSNHSPAEQGPASQDNHRNHLTIAIFSSAAFVSLYALLQHFGIDRDFWVQDVMNRVFSTQGQPNWLAGYIVMTMPLAFVITSSKFKIQSSKLASYGIVLILFLALLWTRSRSGLLGFAMADITFWILIFTKARPFVKRSGLNWLIIHLGILFLILATNNPVRDFIFQVIPRPAADGSWESREIATSQTPRNDVILRKSEHGGTESGDIRRLIWSGALKIAKQNPVFGTGPETFGLTYWQVRPKEANQTSEWNFLYNKAHNEWLNLAANTGLFGLGSHLLLLVWFIVWSFNQLKIRNPKSLPDFAWTKSRRAGEIRNNDQNPKFKNSKLNSHGFDKSNFEFVSNFDIRASDLTTVALLAAVVGIEVVNFFGFSTVTIGTYSYLFMALAVVSTSKTINPQSNFHNFSDDRLSNLRILSFSIVVIGAMFIISKLTIWFLADLQYNLGRQFYSAGYAAEALEPLSQAVNLAPNEPVFRNELAETQAMLAISLSAQDPSSLTPQDDIEPLKEAALVNFRIVSGQSKYNLIFIRTQAQMEFLMRGIDPDLTGEALLLAQKAIDLSPTDPRGYYLLGRMYGELGNKFKAEELYRQALELKPDYEEAKIALDLEFAVPASMGRVLDSSHEL